jgi:hypothetical protein
LIISGILNLTLKKMMVESLRTQPSLFAKNTSGGKAFRFNAHNAARNYALHAS